jgi:4,5-epoxidase
MSVGRIFVAGDAAHIHSPFGGQGMNTGLQDAWNLAWKLDFAARGNANDALLSSYTQERHPIAQGVIETTNFLTTALGARNPFAAGIRDTVIPVVTHIPQIQHAFVERLSGLGNAYAGSPIVEGAGRRYFDDSLRGGEGIGRRFILMIPAVGTGVGTAAADLDERFSEVLEVRPDGGADVVLLRPDGYVAYEAAATDHTAMARVEEVFQRQVHL